MIYVHIIGRPVYIYFYVLFVIISSTYLVSSGRLLADGLISFLSRKCGFLAFDVYVSDDYYCGNANSSDDYSNRRSDQ